MFLVLGLLAILGSGLFSLLLNVSRHLFSTQQPKLRGGGGQWD